MITGAHIVGASLIAQLVDRIVLDRRVGATPFSGASTKLSMAIGSTVPALVVLMLSATLACAFVNFLLRPIGAGYLYPLVFVAAIVAFSLSGELLFSKWQSPELRNRISGRTMVIATILGFLIIVPQTGAPGCARSALDAGLTGAVFFIVVVIWNGIMEKIALAAGPEKKLSLAQELIAASLIALVLLSISSLNFFAGKI
jgi:Na+-translocating ferredoxin:NAD+ oxidoreductase RnfA subunit